MLWLLPIAPALAALVAAVAGRAGRVRPRRGLVAGIAAAGLLATGALAVAAAAGGWRGELPWSELVVLKLALDAPVSVLMAVLVPAVAAAIVSFGAFHEPERGLTRLVATLTGFVGAMELLVLADDLLALLVGWELVGACSWALIGHRWREPAKPRAATLAYLVTRTGDLGLFLAAATAFAAAGSFDFAALPSLSGIHLHLLAAGLLVAAAAKSAQAPFSPWLFEAMSGPVSVSALLHAATMVAAGVYLLIRLHPVLEPVPWFGPVAMAVGLATAVGGGLVAALQPHAKKLLAGSTSAHYGLMMVAVGAGYPAVAALHLLLHAVFKAPLFLAVGIAGECAGGYRLAGMGLGRALPGVAAATAVAAAALAGVPPLGGAWSKEEVLTAAGHAGPWTAVLVALAGGLSAVYATRVFLQAYGPGDAEACGERRPHPLERAMVVALGAITLGFGLLWLPGSRGFARRLLGGEVPEPKAWELTLSLALVALGIAAGRWLVTRRPGLGEQGAAAALSDWFGLPALTRAAVARPALALARGLAAFDDRVLYAPPRLAAALGRRLAPALARGDRRVVDAGVRAAAAFGDRLAALSSRLGEAALDGVPEGLSRATGAASRAARRLQTGLTHHYYRLVVAGLLAWLGIAAALLALRP